MKNWEEGVFEPDTEIDLDSNQGLFVHLYMKPDDIYFTVGDPLNEGRTEDLSPQQKVGTSAPLIGMKLKRFLIKV